MLQFPTLDTPEKLEQERALILEALMQYPWDQDLLWIITELDKQYCTLTP